MLLWYPAQETVSFSILNTFEAVDTVWLLAKPHDFTPPTRKFGSSLFSTHKSYFPSIFFVMWINLLKIDFISVTPQLLFLNLHLTKMISSEFSVLQMTMIWALINCRFCQLKVLESWLVFTVTFFINFCSCVNIGACLTNKQECQSDAKFMTSITFTILLYRWTTMFVKYLRIYVHK